jgi:two-component system, OmpR family, copper resistance phosphate regulon response regulator CusR
MKLLVVEDNEKTALILTKGLLEEGFVVDVCSDGEDGLEQALNNLHDLMILDLNLPLRDGWSVLNELRQQRNHMPVLVLTASAAIDLRVKGLNLGADDYLVKPFALAELVARVRVLLRRRAAQNVVELAFADLIVDAAHNKVMRGDHPIDLTPKEFLLLTLMLRHQGEILSRSVISEQVWDINFDADSNVVDVHVGRMRSKLDGPFERKLIHTVRGRGYVLR